MHKNNKMMPKGIQSMRLEAEAKRAEAARSCRFSVGANVCIT